MMEQGGSEVVGRGKVSEGRGSGRRTKLAEAILYFLFFLRGYVCYVDEEGEEKRKVWC